MLTQATLQEYYSLSTELSDLERRVRKLTATRNGIKDVILKEIRGKQAREPGMFAVRLLDGPRHVSWKDVFVARCGEQAAQNVLDSTAPSVRIKVFVVTEKE